MTTTQRITAGDFVYYVADIENGEPEVGQVIELVEDPSETWAWVAWFDSTDAHSLTDLVHADSVKPEACEQFDTREEERGER